MILEAVIKKKKPALCACDWDFWSGLCQDRGQRHYNVTCSHCSHPCAQLNGWSAVRDVPLAHVSATMSLLIQSIRLWLCCNQSCWFACVHSAGCLIWHSCNKGCAYNNHPAETADMIMTVKCVPEHFLCQGSVRSRSILINWLYG